MKTAPIDSEESAVQKGKWHAEKCSQDIGTESNTGTLYRHTPLVQQKHAQHICPRPPPPASQQKQAVPGGEGEVQPVQYFSVFWEKQAQQLWNNPCDHCLYSYEGVLFPGLAYAGSLSCLLHTKKLLQ